MSIDTLIVVCTALPAALMGVMGFVVTTRPPSKKSKIWYEIMFAVLAAVSVGFVIWGGLRNNVASSKLEGEITGIQNQMKRIAGSQGLSNGHSAKELADAIIGRFGELQNKVNDAEARIAVVQHPPQDRSKIYQDGSAVATVQSGRISTDHRTVFFDLLSDAQNMNFDKPFSFRSMLLTCERVEMNAMIEGSSHGPLMSTRHDVSCAVISD